MVQGRQKMRLFLPHKMKLMWFLLICLLISVKSQESNIQDETENNEFHQETAQNENQENSPHGQEVNEESGGGGTIQDNTGNYGKYYINKKI